MKNHTHAVLAGTGSQHNPKTLSVVTTGTEQEMMKAVSDYNKYPGFYGYWFMVVSKDDSYYKKAVNEPN